MSKYIIELDDRIKLVTSVGVTENGVVYTTSDYVHNLEELNSDYINEHFGELQDEAYKRGYEDGKNQKEDSIEVGDEVVWNNDTTLTITRVHKLDDDEWCDGMAEDGAMYGVLKSNVRKTGKHYDIASILEAMRK